MNLEGRVVNVVQMYDENGQAFFPPTHRDAIIGDLSELDLGTTLNEMDLTLCITVEHTGMLKIKSFNNIIYTFCIDLTRIDNELFQFNKDIILARDIPDMVGRVDFKGVGNDTDDVQIWLENNYLKARVVPRTERYYDNYISHVDRILGSGLIIR